MSEIEYFFDVVHITDMDNFENELRDTLNVAWNAEGWILSALLPTGSGNDFVIIFHHLKNT